MAKTKEYIPREYFWRNRVIMPIAVRVIGIPLVIIKNAHCKRYRPKSKTFLLVANHNETLDPGYEMVSLMKYIRFVSSDHVVRGGFKGWFLNFFGTPIIKYHDRPGEELSRNIVATLHAGISVGIHAEGGMSFNGESRYISPNTAKLVKDADCALITYRSVGGYMRSPRWKRHHRKGPLFGEVVKEYSREEIRAMTQEEVYEIICRDVHVNAYEEQRKRPEAYTGEALAECCEIVLYQCPVCKKIGTLHSKDDVLACDCGYSVRMEADGFFYSNGASNANNTDNANHTDSVSKSNSANNTDSVNKSNSANANRVTGDVCSHDVIFDNICDWDHWQREAVKEYLDQFKESLEEPAFRDEDQTLTKMENLNGALVSRHAVLELYYDRMVLRWEDGEWSVPLTSIKKMDYVKWQSLLVVTDKDYFEISSERPRSATKYIDAWRYLTGRPNY